MLNIPGNAVIEFDYQPRIPFIYQDYSLCQRLFAEMLKKKDAAVFIEGLREGNNFLEAVDGNDRLRQVYIREMIRIHLHTRRSPPEYEDLVYKMLMELADGGESIE